MSYKATCPEMSQHDAERIGKFLGQYEISVGGLAVYQVDVDGGRHRDDALMNTIKDTAGELGAAVVLSVPMAVVALPIIGLLPPVGALLAAISAWSPAALPVLKKVEYDLNKRTPRTGNGKEIAYTEIVFDVANESREHRPWTEYLIGAYGTWCGWYSVTGYKHADMAADGANYVALYGRLPPARNPKLRDGQFAGQPPAADLPTSPLMTQPARGAPPLAKPPAIQSRPAAPAPRHARSPQPARKRSAGRLRRWLEEW